MNFYQLLEALDAHEGRVPFDCPIRLIVGGTAYPVDDVWFEPKQDQTGAICIGEDPR